jgi:pyridoxal phosphate-dependent aminotransferase EpsN
MPRIDLSPPHLGTEVFELVRDAFASDRLAPLGPHVDAFEREFAGAVGVPNALAVSSGTAAIHLALRVLGVGPGDEVICPTLTGIATAAPVVYLGAWPVFLDVDPANWTIDPDLLAEELDTRARRGRLPRAVVAVDLYGQAADYDRLLDPCDRHGVPLVADAAGALGASYRGRAAGSFGSFGAFSLGGNKILTTMAGGVLVTHDARRADRARALASHAPNPSPDFEHPTVGYNYRQSDLLATVGLGQLRTLPDRLAARQRVHQAYRRALHDVPGLAFMPRATYGTPNDWLTCVTIDPAAFGATRDDLLAALEADDIESRPVWTPLHLQPAFAGCRAVGGPVAEVLSETGVCLPSGSALTESEQDRVVAVVRGVQRGARRSSSRPGVSANGEAARNGPADVMTV